MGSCCIIHIRHWRFVRGLLYAYRGRRCRCFWRFYFRCCQGKVKYSLHQGGPFICNTHRRRSLYGIDRCSFIWLFFNHHPSPTKIDSAAHRFGSWLLRGSCTHYVDVLGARVFDGLYGNDYFDCSHYLPSDCSTWF